MTNNNIDMGHPRQRLLFFVAHAIPADAKMVIEKAIKELAAKRQWVIEAPKFIDTEDQLGTRAEDLSDSTIGGELLIYSATAKKLSFEIDALHLEEVEEVVRAIQKVSSEQSLEFEFELDGVFVGAIDGGKPDKSLREGFLGEWRRCLVQAGAGQ